MCGDKSGNLLKRILVLVLCAFISIAYMPGVAYAIDGADADSGDVASEEAVTQDPVNDQAEAVSVEEAAAEQSDSAESSADVIPGDNTESPVPDEADGNGDITDVDEGDDPEDGDEGESLEYEWVCEDEVEDFYSYYDKIFSLPEEAVIPEDDDAFALTVGIWDDEEGEWLTVFSDGEEYEFDADSKELTLYGSRLASDYHGGCSIRFFASASGDPDAGEEWTADGSCRFLGYEDYEEPEPLDIDLNIINNEVKVNESLEYQVHAQGDDLEAILIYQDYKEEEGEANEPDIINKEYYNLNAERQPIVYDREGTFVLRVEAVTYTDGEITERVSDQDTVIVTKDGETGSFSITKVNGSSSFSSGVTAARGSNVTVECSEAGHANHYWIDVNRYDPEMEGGMGDWAGHFADSNGTDLVLNTLSLEAGEYVVSAGANSPGYTSSRSGNTFRLTITEMDLQEGEIYFNVSETEVLTNEKFAISAYCPGAENIRIFIEKDGGYYDSLWAEDKDWFSEDNFSFYKSGTYELYATAGRYEEVNNGNSGDEEDEEPDYEWVESARSQLVTVTVSAPYGEVPLILPEFPDYYVAGEDEIDFELAVPEGATYLDVYIEDASEWDDLFEQEAKSGSIRVVIPAEDLRAGMVIRYSFYAEGVGYEPTSIEKSIPVLGEPSDEISFTASKTDPLINEDVEFTVDTGDLDVDEVRIFDGRGFRYLNREGNGVFKLWHSFDEEGTYTVFAEAVLYNGDDEDSTTFISAPITITSAKLGEVGNFSITKVNGASDFASGIEVARGDIVTIECSEANNAGHYWVDAWQDDYYEDGWPRHYGSYADSDSRTLSLNTIGFEPGEYRINIGANADGYTGISSENEFILNVTEMELPQGEMYFEISKEELETGEDFTFSAYYPGAREIRVYVNYDRDPDWYRESGWYEDYYQDNHNYRDPGTYKIVAAAYGYDENDDFIKLCESEPKIVTVTAPNGELSLDMPELPAYLTAGEGGLNFSVAVPQNADGMRVSVYREGNDGENLYEKEKSSGSFSVSIPADALIEDSTIRVEAEAWGRGYESARGELRIPVIGETSDSLTLTADRTDILVNEDVEFMLDTGDLEVSDVWFCFDGNEEGSDRSSYNKYYKTYGFGREGAYTVYAKVSLSADDEEVWLTSEPVTVNVASNGKVGSFDVTEVNGTQNIGSVTVAQGDLVNITCTESQNADHYWIDVFKKNEWGWNWEEHPANSDQPLLSLGTANMYPGEYRLIVKANAKGYEEREAERVIGLTVTENDLPDDALIFNVSKTNLLTNEPFTYSAYCPAAGWISVYMDYDNDKYWSTDDWSGTSAYGNSGIYKLTAVARVYDSETGEARDITASRTMTVEAPNGELTLAAPELPDYLEAGKDGLSFETIMPENASGMRVEVRSEGNYWEDLYEKAVNSGKISADIPAENIHEDSFIIVRIEAWGLGYERTAVERRIPVISESSDSLTLTADKSEVFVNEDVEYKLNTGDLEVYEVCFYDAFGGNSWAERHSDGYYYTNYNYGEAGRYTVYAKAEVYRDGDYEWLTSEPVTVTVRSNGKVGAFHVTEVNGIADPDEVTVEKGNMVHVICTESQNADHYWIDIFKDDGYGGWDEIGHEADSDQPEMSLTTANLETGNYRLVVKANGTGYEERQADSYIYLKVTESTLPDDALIFNVSKTDLLTSEQYTYSAYCPSTDDITVYMNYDNDRGWNSDNSTGRDSYGNSGVYKLTAVAQIYDDETGEYREVTASHTMTVEAPYGELTLAAPELPSYLVAGEDGLNFEAAMPENADGLRVRVKSEDDGYWEDFYDNETESGNLSVNIPAGSFHEGAQIHVEIEAWGRGYEFAREEFRIPVIGQISDSLTLTTETPEVLVNTDVEFKLNTGNLTVDSVTFYDSFGGYDSYDDWDEVNNYYKTYWYGETGKFTVYAKVEGFENDEFKVLTSNPVEINVTSYGKTGSFHITEVNGVTDQESVTVQKGSLVNVSYTESANADHYWIDLDYYDEYNGWLWYDHFADTDQLTASLGTGALPAGEYRMVVKSDAEGYESREADNVIGLTVTENDQVEMMLDVSKTQLITGEQFTYSAYCPDSYGVTVYMDYDNDRGWSRNEWSGTDSYSRSGTYRLAAVGGTYDDVTGEYSEIVASKVITVTAPNGNFAIETPAGLPDSIQVGSENIPFTAVKPDNASGMRVRAWTEGNDYYELYNNETDSDTLDADLDTSYLSEGTTIYIRIEAWGLGYEHTEKTITIPVTGAPSDSVSIEAEKTEALINEQVGFTISADNDAQIAEARIFDGHELSGEELLPDEDGKVRTEVWFNESGTFSIYAKVRLEGSDDWITTEVVSVRVDSNGKLPLTALAVPDEICTGNDLTVTAEKPENAGAYGLEAYYYDDTGCKQYVYGNYYDDSDDEPVSDVWTDEEDSISLTIPGSYLDEGFNFYVKIKGWGIGYDYNEVSSPVRVLGHDWGDWVVTTQPTQDEAGVKTRTCNRCGHTETEEIPAGTHIHTLEYVEAVEADCENAGHGAYWICTECGELFADEAGESPIDEPAIYPALEHDYGDWEVVTPASCTEDGEETATCSRCGETVTRVIDALGHLPAEPVETDVVPATCSTPGHHDLVTICTRCNNEISRETIEDPIDPDAHSWGAWTDTGDGEHHVRTCEHYSGHTESAPHSWDNGTVTTHATCLTDGELTFTCDDCGATRTEVIQAAGHHTVENWTVTKPATCTEAGSRTGECSVCHQTITEVIPINENAHDWGEWTVTREATCIAGGEETRVCRHNADHKQTRQTDIDSSAHKWGDWTDSHDGVHHQRICEYDHSHIDKVAHSYGEWTVTKAATCTETGSRERECSVCHYKDIEEIPVNANAHKWGAWTKLDANQHQRVCENDPEHVEKADHVWNAGEVTTPATCDAAGEKTLTCTVCGETKTETIPATGQHTVENWTVTKPATCSEAGSKTGKCTLCGQTVTEAIPIDENAHSWGPWTDAKDGETHKRVCENDSDHVETTYHNWERKEIQSRTCTQDGITKLTCKDCGATQTLTIPAEGHSYGEWTVTKAATCTETGSREKECSVCHEKVTEEIPMTAHAWNAGYTVDKEATYDEEGSESIHCSVCGAIQEGSARPIPQLDRSEQKGEDGTPVGKGASAEAAEKEITNLPSDNDPKGTAFGKLMLKSSKQTKTSITLSWKGVSGTVKYVVYGNVCGKTKKLQKLYETGSKTYTVKKIAGKSLKKSTFHKFMVVALDSSNHVVSTSKIIHVATKTKTNYTSVTTKAKKNKVTVKKGKTFKLGAKAVGKKVTKHFKMRYESSDPSIATVSTAGTIKGVKKGKCKVYVYAQNGVYKIISVTVK